MAIAASLRPLIPFPTRFPSQEGDYMIPVEFQSDMVQIHAKAGFDKAGR